jgi:hypothetical protein
MKLRHWRFHTMLLPALPVMLDGYVRVLGLPGILPWPETDGFQFMRFLIVFFGNTAAVGLTVGAMNEWRFLE